MDGNAERVYFPSSGPVWDLDASEYDFLDQPRGQIHVILIDNYEEPSNDDLFFKHYTTSQGDWCRL